MTNIYQGNLATAGTKRLGVKESFQVGKVTLGVVTVVIMFLLGVLYMLQVNESSTMGYEIHSNEQAISTLEDTKKQLSVEEAKLKALQGLEAEIQKLNYAEVEQVGYTSAIQHEREALVKR